MQRVILILLFFTFSFACDVDDRIMFSIAEIEKHKDRPVGYPYLISFNNKKDINRLDNNIKRFFLDERTIDCIDKKTCKTILNILIQNKITNLDCGTYQINYKFWRMPLDDYFDIKKSYIKACAIIENHNKVEWSWSNIANYHSKTPHLNSRYKTLLLSSIQKNMEN